MHVNGSPRSSLRLTSEIVVGTIEAGDMASTGPLEITVTNPGMDSAHSNSAFLAVKNPVPTINQLSPGSVAAGSPGFILEISGEDFVDGAEVGWNGVLRPADFVNSALLELDVSPEDVSDGQSVSIFVANPDPSEGISNVATLLVTTLGSEVFLDGFESGGTGAWSDTVN